MNNMDNKKITSPWPVLVVLFILFPPLGLLGAFGWFAYQQAKKNGQVNDRQLKAELEGIKRSGMAAREKFLRRLKEEDVAEQPHSSQPHSHTPTSYSYDACAREKRLEQLKVLKSAGLLDEWEYQQRRQAILK